MSTWITNKKPWPQGGTSIVASAAVTAAATTTPIRIGKGLYYFVFAVTALSNGTGDGLRVEVQFNKYSNNGVNVSSKLVFDGDFVTANTIDVTVGGVAAAQVTFTTDHDTTADLLVVAIAALTGITCELDAADATNRTFLIYKTALTAIGTVTEVVASGAGQVSGTITYDGDWYTAGVLYFDDAIQGGVMDAADEYPLIVENPYDYQVRLKYTIVSTPSVTFSVAAYPLNSRKTT